MIKLNNLTLSYGFKPLFKNLSLNLPSGKMMLLIGANGSGKTSLLKIICGLAEYQAGKITNDSGATLKSRDLRRKSYLLTHHTPAFDEISLKNNLRFFLALQNLPTLTDKKWQTLLGSLKLDKYLEIDCGWLSAGTKQKLGIMYAFMRRAQVLCLDEPFNGLDTKARLNLLDLLNDTVKNENTTVVMSAHQFDENWPKIDQLWLIKEEKTYHQIIVYNDPDKGFIKKNIHQIGY